MQAGKLRNDGSHGNDKCNNGKSPPKHEDKDFKPCCIHGEHSKHLYEECCANPRNQAKLLQTTTSASMKVAIKTTIAAQVATMSWAGALS
jgi:hypothetical protein